MSDRGSAGDPPAKETARSSEQGGDAGVQTVDGSEEDGKAAGSGPSERSTREWLADVRAAPRPRYTAIAAAATAGVALSSIHWIGLIVGGVLVGLFSKSLGRAVAAGVGFGVLVWLVFAALVSAAGNAGPYLATGPIAGLSVAIPVVLGGFGSLIRGVF